MQNEVLKIANSYGNVDVRDGAPGGYVHIRGKRLQPLCRKLGIKFAQALIGFEDGRYGYQPKLDGVVVSARSAPKLRLEIKALKERSKKRPKKTQAQLRAERKRRQERDIERLAAAIRERFPSMPEGEENSIATHACQIGSGRVGRSSVAGDSVKAAVVAHVRHQYTAYDDLLGNAKDFAVDWEDRQTARTEVRDQVRSQIVEIVKKWEQPMSNVE